MVSRFDDTPPSTVTASSTVEDHELIRSVQQGSWDAFNKLYERYLPVVYRRVRYMVPETEAEDITQDIFIAIMKSLKNFRFEAQFSTWLRTLVNRQVADYYRSRRPKVETISLDAELDDPMNSATHREFNLSIENRTTVFSTESDRDDLIILRQEIRNLPENYREIIMLRFVDGLQFDEIARAQGQSLEATKSLFRRAISALQKRISVDTDQPGERYP